MTRDDLINNLGTIAKSGTKAFMEAATMAAESNGDLTMIGQFGVGFYSAYLVSERVCVVSKSVDDDQYIWDSNAGGTFQVRKDESFEFGEIKRGSKVICHLKEDAWEFLESDRLKGLVLKHSAFVGFPIEVYMEYRKEEPVPGSEDLKVTISHGWELMNKNKPVWMRQPEEVTHEEYAEMYKFLSGDWEDHLAAKHVLQTGQVDFKFLVFCPRSPPKDMFDMGKMATRLSIRLYVRRVFITEFSDLIPKWMGFVKGIIDSDDMPLNISREKLQQNAILKLIKTSLVKNIFQMFGDIAKTSEYKQFYESFAQCLKFGCYEDHANRSSIIPLLRYHSTLSGEDMVSFDDYITRMKPGQQHILYITGRSRRDASRSPYIETLKRDGFEVLYMVDAVDEYALQFIKEYKGNVLLSCMSMDVSRLMGQTRSEEDLREEFEPLRRHMTPILAHKVETIFFTGLSSELVGRLVSQESQLPKLELNFKHSFLREIGKYYLKDVSITAELVGVLYDIANIQSDGNEMLSTDEFCKRCESLIVRLNGGDQADPTGLLPSPITETTVQRADLGDVTKRRKGVDLLSCGNVVRVVRPDLARRATLSFVEDGAATVEVMYLKRGGIEDEEDSVPAKAVRKLLDFEEVSTSADEFAAFRENLFKAASAAKEEGNQLFKLKDYDAAIERYSTIICAFASRPRTQGSVVLVRSGNRLKTVTVTSVDRDDGTCSLSDGSEISPGAALPVLPELLPLHTAAYMNRARCRQNLGFHLEAVQDLSLVLGLWTAADPRMLEADPEMQDASTKGHYTAQYLRARSAVACGFVKLAATDVKDALARNPPAATVKQLRQLKCEVQAVQEEHRRVNGPLSKELARLKIALGAGPELS